MPNYDEKFMKAKVREYNDVIKTNFWGVIKYQKSVHHTCIACITIGSVIRRDEKNYPQVYL